MILVLIFFGDIRWFYNSLEDFFRWKLTDNENVFVSSLQTSVDDAKASVASVVNLDQSILPSRDWHTEDLKLEAQAALSVEFGSGTSKTLFQKNEEKRLPIASLTKLMTALIVLENYDLSQKITVSGGAMAQKGEQGDLQLGQALSVKNLLYITLIESSNRAAFLLAEPIGVPRFIALMNLQAQKIGLANTHFQDTTGLDSRSYSTVQDLAILSEYLFKNYPLFKEIIGLKEYNVYLDSGILHHKLVNTNKLLGENSIIGGKTGFTDEAQGCFMVIQNSPDKANYIVSIVLGSSDRFFQMQHIINWLSAAYTW